MSDFALPVPGSSPSAGNAGAGQKTTTLDPATARKFEAAFLSEMLKQSGLTRSLGAMAGEGGDNGFTDLLVREIADRIAETRSLGIAERLSGQFGAQE